MGPLQGIRIIEMAALGPGPFAGMMLADMGAEVIIVDRYKDESENRIANCHTRGKKSISLNLKDADDIETLLKLVEKADVLFEGFRPGVMERLGIGPDVCMQRNPRLIYGRMTGWGQTGPLAKAAGHDINYISLTGVLHAIGHQESKPIPPLNLIGDYGGGGMFLVTGILAAIIERQKSGKGQVIDVAMTDGSAVLMSIINTLDNLGFWQTKRGSNWLDSGTHYYDTYETKDKKYVSIGSIEPQFYHLLIDTLQLDKEKFKAQMDPSQWPILKAELLQVFKTKTRAEWCEIMEGTDICFAPVLDYKEAPQHPHNVARKTYTKVDDMIQPAPAPRFSRTPSEIMFGSHASGEDTETILKEWGAK
jgi:alpha-methylacyl-CoA racemase